MDIKKKARMWLCISVVLMLISMIGASVVQTSGGSVTVKDLHWETTAGYQMSGLLFVPKGVSDKNKAPAIVTSHGMFNNREMQDANFVELSRRGYVVLSMDMFSHGNSENVANIGILTTGMYEAVKMMATLNYVDTSRIGITGHSLGGMSSNTAITKIMQRLRDLFPQYC
jgi:cephalosporin-C deacetylase-like acetyl esterase